MFKVLREIIKSGLLGPLLFEGREFFFAPSAYFQVRQDYHRTKTDLSREAFAFSVSRAQSSEKRVLIASMSDSIYQIKLEAMLALGLQREGCEVKVLTTSPINVWAHRYFRLFGVDKFIYWESIGLGAEKERECESAAAGLLGKLRDFRDWKAAEYDCSWIGPQVLSSIARRIFKGAPNPEDPAVKPILKELVIEAIRKVELAKQLFSEEKFDLMYLIEANYTLMGPIVDVAIASGVDVIQVVQPSRDDALFLKRLTKRTRRHHPASVDPETFAEQSRITWTEKHEGWLQQEFANRYGGKWFLQARNQIGTRHFDREQLLNELRIPSDRPIAAVFSHILWDANLFYGEDLFMDYEDWFVQTLKAACRNPNVTWLIKLHPANVWKRARDRAEGELAEEVLVREHIGTLPDHVKLLRPDAPISTRSFFEIVDFGITVRGTTGMEMPCFGVTTITAGTGRYAGLGFTLDPKSKEEYLETLGNLPNIPRISPAQIEMAKKHAFIAFGLRPWEMNSFRSVFNYQKRGHHPLDHNLILNEKIETGSRGRDLKNWAEWAVRSRKVDYVGKFEAR